MLKVLLASGADIAARDDHGNNALHIALSRPHKEDLASQLIKLLLNSSGSSGSGGATGSSKDAKEPKATAAVSSGSTLQREWSEAERLEVARARNAAGKQPEDLVTGKKVKKLLQDEIR